MSGGNSSSFGESSRLVSHSLTLSLPELVLCSYGFHLELDITDLSPDGPNQLRVILSKVTAFEKTMLNF